MKAIEPRAGVHLKALHRWDLTPAEAIAVQRELSARVSTGDRVGQVRHVAGIDAGIEQDGRVIRAAAVVLGFPGLALVDSAVVRLPLAFPYIPGLLSFREAPAALAALAKLRVAPDLILYDGQGIAHPRRFGIASHLGLWADLPTIGVAKTRLVGAYRDPPQRRGAWSPLTDGGEIIGAVLRTRAGARPLFVSVGHRVSLAGAVAWVMACVTRYRLPETTRQAHRLASRAGD